MKGKTSSKCENCGRPSGGHNLCKKCRRNTWRDWRKMQHRLPATYKQAEERG